MRGALMMPVAVLGFMGCAVGPSAQTFAPAKGPQGIEADLHFRRGRLVGELLEVQDTVLVVLAAKRVVVVPLRVIRVGSFRTRGAVILDGRATLTTLAWLRMVSRFPSGLTPELNARLLAAYGQTAPDGPP